MHVLCIQNFVVVSESKVEGMPRSSGRLFRYMSPLEESRSDRASSASTATPRPSRKRHANDGQVRGPLGVGRTVRRGTR